MLTVVATQVVPGNSGNTLLARILGNGGVPITQASLTSVAVVTTDLTKEAITNGSGAVATHAPSVASTVFDALQQNDPIWTKDSVANPSTIPGDVGNYGYNFKYTVPASDFAVSGDKFQCDLVVTPVSGQPFRVIFWVGTYKVYG